MLSQPTTKSRGRYKRAIMVTLDETTAANVRKRAQKEGRSAANLCRQFIERSLQQPKEASHE